MKFKISVAIRKKNKITVNYHDSMIFIKVILSFKSYNKCIRYLKLRFRRPKLRQRLSPAMGLSYVFTLCIICIQCIL